MKKKTELSAAAGHAFAHAESRIKTFIKNVDDMTNQAVDLYRENIFFIGRELMLLKCRVNHGEFDDWLKRDTALSFPKAKQALGYFRVIGKKSTVDFLDASAIAKLPPPKELPPTRMINSKIAKALYLGKITESEVKMLTDSGKKSREEILELGTLVSEGEDKISGKKLLENKSTAETLTPEQESERRQIANSAWRRMLQAMEDNVLKDVIWARLPDVELEACRDLCIEIKDAMEKALKSRKNPKKASN